MAGSHSTFPLPLKENVNFVPGIKSWEDCKRWYHSTKPGQFIFRGLPSSITSVHFLASLPLRIIVVSTL
jgi:hypothetical protein